MTVVLVTVANYAFTSIGVTKDETCMSYIVSYIMPSAIYCKFVP